MHSDRPRVTSHSLISGTFRLLAIGDWLTFAVALGTRSGESYFACTDESSLDVHAVGLVIAVVCLVLALVPV